MNTSGARRLVIVSLMIGAALLAMTGCRQSELIDPPPISMTNQGLQTTQLRQAILKGMANRGWTVKAEKPGEIIAEILVRAKHRAIIGIAYNQKRITFRYVDSDNLKYGVSSSGARTIHKNYNTWAQSLREDINREVMMIDIGGSNKSTFKPLPSGTN